MVKGQISEQNRLLDHAQDELFALEGELAQKKALSSDLQDQITKAQEQIEALKKSNTSSAKTKAALAQKQKQIDELNATLEQLQSMM